MRHGAQLLSPRQSSATPLGSSAARTHGPTWIIVVVAGMTAFMLFAATRTFGVFVTLNPYTTEFTTLGAFRSRAPG